MRTFLKPRFLLILCVLSTAAARQFPEPLPPSYRSFEFPPPVVAAAIPEPCRLANASRPCKADPWLELSLEKEFWAYVQRSDTHAMQRWIDKTRRYTELSRSPYQGRLLMLAAFGEVMIFRGHALHDPKGLWAAGKALSFIESSHKHADQVPSAISMRLFLRAFISYTLQRTPDGDAALESLLALPSAFGDYGSEGVTVGAFGLMALLDKQKVQRGLEILDDCNNPHCSRTTSIAPFKMVGNAIAMAEAQAYLGQSSQARQILQDAIGWARERFYPEVLLERLSRVEAELLDPNHGLAQKWRAQSGLGAIRLPLGPSQSHYACATCHAGTEVPDYYYSWRSSQQLE